MPTLFQGLCNSAETLWQFLSWQTSTYSCDNFVVYTLHIKLHPGKDDDDTAH